MPAVYVEEAQALRAFATRYRAWCAGDAAGLEAGFDDLTHAVAGVAAHFDDALLLDELPAPLLAAAPQTAALTVLAAHAVLVTAGDRDLLPAPDELDELLGRPRVAGWIAAVAEGRWPDPAPDEDRDVAADADARPTFEDRDVALTAVRTALSMGLRAVYDVPAEASEEALRGAAVRALRTVAETVLRHLRRAAFPAWGAETARGLVQLSVEMLSLALTLGPQDPEPPFVDPEQQALTYLGWGDTLVGPGATITGATAEALMQVGELAYALSFGIAVAEVLAEEDLPPALDRQARVTLAEAVHAVGERAMLAGIDPAFVNPQALIAAYQFDTGLLEAAVLADAGEDPLLTTADISDWLRRDDLPGWVARLQTDPESPIVNPAAAARPTVPVPAAAVEDLRRALAAIRAPYQDLAERFVPDGLGMRDWEPEDAAAAGALCVAPARAMRGALRPAVSTHDLDRRTAALVSALRLVVAGLVVMSDNATRPLIGRRVLTADQLGVLARKAGV